MSLRSGLIEPSLMLAQIRSASIQGIDAFPVEVEVDSGPGPQQIVLVGLPDAAVRESRDRVGTAIINSGFRFPPGRTTINLAPADVRKEGPSFDLPIALGILAASKQLTPGDLTAFAMVGELALTGAVRAVKGALALALRARAEGCRGILLPAENAPEAGVVDRLEVIPIRSLQEAAQFLGGEISIQPLRVDTEALFRGGTGDSIDMAEVRGQESVKRALEVAAAGGHNILLLFQFPHQLYLTVINRNPNKTTSFTVPKPCQQFLFLFLSPPPVFGVHDFPLVTTGKPLNRFIGVIPSLLFTPRKIHSIHQQVLNLGGLPVTFSGAGSYSSFVQARCNSLQSENSCTFDFVNNWQNTVTKFNSCISRSFIHQANIKFWGSCSQFNVILTANTKRIFYTLLNHFSFFLRNQSQDADGKFIKVWGINNFYVNARIIYH